MSGQRSRPLSHASSGVPLSSRSICSLLGRGWVRLGEHLDEPVLRDPERLKVPSSAYSATTWYLLLHSKQPMSLAVGILVTDLAIDGDHVEPELPRRPGLFFSAFSSTIT